MADKPSAWALRTAIALMRDAGGAQLRNVSDLELLARPVIHKIASMIDHETGVAELLKAAENILQFNDSSFPASVRLKKAIDGVEK